MRARAAVHRVIFGEKSTVPFAAIPSGREKLHRVSRLLHARTVADEGENFLNGTWPAYANIIAREEAGRRWRGLLWTCVCVYSTYAASANGCVNETTLGTIVRLPKKIERIILFSLATYDSRDVNIFRRIRAYNDTYRTREKWISISYILCATDIKSDWYVKRIRYTQRRNIIRVLLFSHAYSVHNESILFYVTSTDTVCVCVCVRARIKRYIHHDCTEKHHGELDDGKISIFENTVSCRGTTGQRVSGKSPEMIPFGCVIIRRRNAGEIIPRVIETGTVPNVYGGKTNNIPFTRESRSARRAKNRLRESSAR